MTEMGAPVVSIVLCTWNRATLLGDALAALVDQRDAPAHEVIVVDNGSSDATCEVARRSAARHAHVRCLTEPRRGLSHARNRGVAEACGGIVAFTDDDVRVPDSWVRAMAEAFDRYADAAYVGGPVEPEWTGPVPPWLTPRHWAPLGVQGHGSEPFRVDADRRVCLIGANLAFRRDALEAAGMFDVAVQRIGRGGGSTEDHELQQRVWAAGVFGMYVPDLRVRAIVGGERLRKAHHRRWHYSHGRHVARMRLPDIEASTQRILGVPGHLIRQAIVDAGALVADLANGRSPAFERETRLCFAAGFVRERWM